jgi:cerevisin
VRFIPILHYLIDEPFELDSGIYTEHWDFGRRASWGAVFGPYQKADLDGHGTLVASMAIGAMYGVAKRANAIAVKVIQGNNGKLSDGIYGIEWSVQAAVDSKRPSIINFSIYAPHNQALKMAVITGIMAGVHFTACAGDKHADVTRYFAGVGE